MDEVQREILATEKARGPDYDNAADHQNRPQNSREFHPAFNLAKPPVLGHLAECAESLLVF